MGGRLDTLVKFLYKATIVGCAGALLYFPFHFGANYEKHRKLNLFHHVKQANISQDAKYICNTSFFEQERQGGLVLENLETSERKRLTQTTNPQTVVGWLNSRSILFSELKDKYETFYKLSLDSLQIEPLFADKGVQSRFLTKNGKITCTNESEIYFFDINSRKKTTLTNEKADQSTIVDLQLDKSEEHLYYLLKYRDRTALTRVSLSSGASEILYETRQELTNLRLSNDCKDILFFESDGAKKTINICNTNSRGLDSFLEHEEGTTCLAFHDRKRILLARHDDKLGDALVLYDSLTGDTKVLKESERGVGYSLPTIGQFDILLLQKYPLTGNDPSKFDILSLDLEKMALTNVTRDNPKGIDKLVSQLNGNEFVYLSSKNSMSYVMQDLLLRNLSTNDVKQLTFNARYSSHNMLYKRISIDLLILALLGLMGSCVYARYKRDKMVRSRELNDAPYPASIRIETVVDGILRSFSKKPMVSAIAPTLALGYYGTQNVFGPEIPIRPELLFANYLGAAVCFAALYTSFYHLFNNLTLREPKIINELRRQKNFFLSRFYRMKGQTDNEMTCIENVRGTLEYQDEEYFSLKAFQQFAKGEEATAFKTLFQMFDFMILNRQSDAYITPDARVTDFLYRIDNRTLGKVIRRTPKAVKYHIDLIINNISRRNERAVKESSENARLALVGKHAEGIRAFEAEYALLRGREEEADRIFRDIYLKAEKEGRLELTFGRSKNRVFTAKGVVSQAYAFKEARLSELQGEKENIAGLEQIVLDVDQGLPRYLTIFRPDHNYVSVLRQEDGIRLSDFLRHNNHARNRVLLNVLKYQALIQAGLKAHEKVDNIAHIRKDITDDAILPANVKKILKENIEVTAKYFDGLPLVYDRDGHADNYLITSKEKVIALDFPTRPANVPLFSTAKLLERGRIFGNTASEFEQREFYVLKSMEFPKDLMPNSETDQDLLIPNYYNSVIMKALSFHSFSSSMDSGRELRLAFLDNACNGIRRILERYQKFYSTEELRCYDNLLVLAELRN